MNKNDKIFQVIQKKTFRITIVLKKNVFLHSNFKNYSYEQGGDNEFC